MSRSFPVRVVVVLMAVVLAVLTIDRPAPAAAAGDEDVVTKMSATKLEKLLRSNEEYKVKKVKQNAFLVEVDDLKFVVFTDTNSLGTWAAYQGVKVSLSRINEWNQKARFSRAYIDKDGDPVLESDLVLVAGVTEGNIKEWLKVWLVSLKAFYKFIGDCDTDTSGRIDS